MQVAMATTAMVVTASRRSRAIKMSARQPASASGKLAASNMAAAALLCAQIGSAWASDWTLGASVTASETYTDNVALSTAGSAKSDWITAITPTVTAKKDGARLKVDANYSNQNLFYAADSARNTTHHQLSARTNMELVENELFIDATASITQAPISPLASSGIDNSNSSGNISSVRALNISPYWVHRFGSTATLNARYTASDVSNSNSALSGSRNSTTNISLGSGTDFGRISWGLTVADQSIDYKGRSDVAFSTASVGLGYLFSPGLKVVSTLGEESNRYASTTGTASKGVFWNTTTYWAPTIRTSLAVGFGHHYYGDSWNMAFRTRGAHAEWTADYSESVTTANSQYGAVIPTQVGTLSGIYNDSTQIQTNQVFLNQRFTTAYSWKRGRSGITLNAFHTRQTAQESGQITGVLNNGAFQNVNSIKQVGFNASWAWQWTPLMRSTISGGLSRNSYTELSRDDAMAHIQLGLNRKFSPQLSGVLTLRRQTRDSNQDADFNENALSCAVTYTF